jgi:hypothetical protein
LPVSRSPAAARGRRTALAAAGDLLLLVLFAALGRRAHDEGSAVAGTLTVAAPFLIGYVLAAAVLRLDRDPLGVRKGAAVWALGLVLGLLLRGTAFDRGLAPTFVAVAVLVTGALLVGWRAALVRRRWSPTGGRAG